MSPEESHRILRIAHELDVAFDWDSAPGGYDYWAEVMERLRQIAVSSQTRAVQVT